jgi:hypothetical protein
VSHSRAFSAVQGASTGTCFDISSMRVCSCAASGRISGSGGIVPVYSSLPVLEET